MKHSILICLLYLSLITVAQPYTYYEFGLYKVVEDPNTLELTIEIRNVESDIDCCQDVDGWMNFESGSKQQSILAFSSSRGGLEDKMPAVGFTLTYDDKSDVNFIRRTNGSVLTSLDDGYSFTPAYLAQNYDADNDNWIGVNGVDNTIWNSYKNLFPGKTTTPTRKFNVGAFFLLEYNGQTDRFEPVKDSSILEKAFCQRTRFTFGGVESSD